MTTDKEVVPAEESSAKPIVWFVILGLIVFLLFFGFYFSLGPH